MVEGDGKWLKHKRGQGVSLLKHQRWDTIYCELSEDTRFA